MEHNLELALIALTTGIYVLTVAEDDQHHGMSSSWVTQVSGTPPLFIAAVDNDHFTKTIIARTRVFGLNVIGTRYRAVEDYFHSPQARRPDNIEVLNYELSPKLKVPWLERAAVAIEARVSSSHVTGDHTIFVAEPVGVRIGAPDRPLSSLDLDYVYIGGNEVIPRDRTGW